MSKNYTIVCHNDDTILFSYSTPVVFHSPGSRPKITDKKWSSTTSRHINKFLNEEDFDKDMCEIVPQEVIQELIESKNISIK